MQALKVMSVFGTRPEAIKMAPLVLELARRPGISATVCVTAQHREMLDSVLSVFGITPDFDLDIMQRGQSLADITTRILYGLGAIFDENRPDLVLVHGDTTTTLAAALAAFYAKIPVGHVEAGLRTFDRYSPYPEEMNRRLTGQLTTLHFAPTARNAANLRREAAEGRIFVTGNTVIDALRYTAHGEGFSSEVLRDIDYVNHRVVTMTCHRRENYGEPMRNIMHAVRTTAERFPDITVVYPVHLSPVVRETAHGILSGVSNVKLIEPLDAVDMHRLMAKSYMVMTDSGGIQEEAPALGKPVLVLRRETERPEAVEAGTVILAGTEQAAVEHLAAELLTDKDKYSAMARSVNPYGDGKACPRIADAILYSFGRSERAPEEFHP
jgi:UDP-N-acetylglucosamine 2-epimerase